MTSRPAPDAAGSREAGRWVSTCRSHWASTTETSLGDPTSRMPENNRHAEGATTWPTQSQHDTKEAAAQTGTSGSRRRENDEGEVAWKPDRHWSVPAGRPPRCVVPS